MTVSFIGSFITRLDWDYPNTVEPQVSGPQYKDYLRLLATFASSGTGNYQGNRLWVARRTLSIASPTDQLDLAGGLSDNYGNTLTLSKIKVLMIHNRGNVAGDDDDATATPAAGEDLLIGGAASAAWAAMFNGDVDATVLLRTDGQFAVCAPVDGYSVTAGTADILQIEHAGVLADISYDIAIVGIE